MMTKRSNFSYAGPKKLTDVLKVELLEEKSSTDITDLWMTFHEEKDNVHGWALESDEAKTVLTRAAQCPFFIHPVFREDGYFMVLSQFQPPHHFFLALLEDYRLDPSRAQPLMTVATFDDLSESKGLTLVRCDVINRGIQDDEAFKICRGLLAGYANDDDFRNVHVFNKAPDAFDVDDYVSVKQRKWKEEALNIMEGEIVEEEPEFGGAGEGTTVKKGV